MAEGSDSKVLGDYHGTPILKTTIAVTNAGDGLSKSMKVDPSVLEVDTEVMVLIRCTVSKHQYALIDEDTPAFELKQSLRAETATIVTGQTFERKLKAEADRIAKAEREAQGEHRLPDPDSGGGLGDIEDEDEDDPANVT